MNVDGFICSSFKLLEEGSRCLEVNDCLINSQSLWVVPGSHGEDSSYEMIHLI